MTRVVDLPSHKRPREKLVEKGSENLSDAELVAILLRAGYKGKNVIDIAKKLLKKLPANKLLDTTYNDLIKIKGISQAKACTILAAFELSKRAHKSFSSTLPIIKSPQDAVDQLSELRNYKKEYFIALYLNIRGQLVHKETISVGTLSQSLVHPREVFKPAINNLAEAIVVAHNHPSNNIEPSKEDVLVTENLVRSGKILDIKLKDHLIITKDSYFSFKEKGMIHG